MAVEAEAGNGKEAIVSVGNLDELEMKMRKFQCSLT